MANNIKQVNANLIVVNNKHIKKDMQGNWLVEEELRPSEQRAFNNYLKAIKYAEEE